MKPKTKAFADKLLSDPKTSATQAYIDTHQTNNRNTAKIEASKLLTKPNVQIYLNQHIDKAKNRVVELIDSDKEEIAFKSSEAVLDRALGKPTQRTEVSAQVVTLNLSLKDVVEEQT